MTQHGVLCRDRRAKCLEDYPCARRLGKEPAKSDLAGPWCKTGHYLGTCPQGLAMQGQRKHRAGWSRHPT